MKIQLWKMNRKETMIRIIDGKSEYAIDMPTEYAVTMANDIIKLNNSNKKHITIDTEE